MSNLLTLLTQLPNSYTGPTQQQKAPYSVVGVGEGELAAQMAHTALSQHLLKEGTQFILFSPDGEEEALTYAQLSNVANVTSQCIGTGGVPDHIDVLVPSGPLATYHFVQYLLHATGQAEEAAKANQLLADLAEQCGPEAGEKSPARQLAWSLWDRVPLLLTATDTPGLLYAWQSLLARIGKMPALPVLGDPLPFVSGAFEAKHESGDGRVVLLLGDLDPRLELAQEILESRTDETIHIPATTSSDTLAGQLSLWYFGAWVAAYVAERYQKDHEDPATLGQAQALLAGEEPSDQENKKEEIEN